MVELLVLLWGDKLKVATAVVPLAVVSVVALGLGWNWTVGVPCEVECELAVKIRGGDVGGDVVSWKTGSRCRST